MKDFSIKLVFVGLVLWGSHAACSNDESQTLDATIALVGGRVIHSPDADPLDHATIVIEDGLISFVGREVDVTVPDGATVIDCSGMTLLSGFQNSHVHFTEQKWDDAGAQTALKLSGQIQKMLTCYGFTTVVDTGSLLANTIEIRRRINGSEVDGPRILTAGLPLYPPGGVPFYVKENLPPELIESLPQAATTNKAREFVRENLELGSDVIKIFTGSWASRNQVIPMPQVVASAVVSEAHRQNRLVFAHPSNVEGLEIALYAEVDVLAHTVDDTNGLGPHHLQRMKEQGVALVPTLSLIAQNGRREVLDQVRDYVELGGQILFGTDVGFIEKYDPATEYVLMQAAGLTWQQIVESLTTNPASRFNEGDRRGTIAPGMDADIVILGTDPSEGPHAFVDVRFTIQRGRVIYRRP